MAPKRAASRRQPRKSGWWRLHFLKLGAGRFKVSGLRGWFLGETYAVGRLGRRRWSRVVMRRVSFWYWFGSYFAHFIYNLVVM